MGMAKPKPSTEVEEEELEALEYLAETMPMTSPWIVKQRAAGVAGV